MRFRTRSAPWWLALALGFLACEPHPRPGQGRTISLRWIEDESAGRFDARALADRQPVFEWSFQSPEDLEAWRTVPSSTADSRPAELRLGKRGVELAAADELNLERAVDFKAGEVDSLEVEVGRASADLELRWSGPEGPLTSVAVAAAPRVEKVRGQGRRTVFRFFLADHPDWRDPVGRLRLRLWPRAQAQSVEILRVLGYRETLIPERLQAARNRSWKVEQQQDVRNALLGVPGHPLERQFVVPANSELRFAYTTPRTVPLPVDFRVAVEPVDGERQVLFEATLEPQRVGRWHEGAVDLSTWQGQEIRLALETEIEEGRELGAGFPFWAHPEVLSPGDRSGLPNILLISIDTLRADHLSLYGYSRPTSPHLDAWAGRSAVVFENAVAPSPWTQPSHVSIFTGLNPHRHGVNAMAAAPQSLAMMAEMLRAQGYATAAFTGSGIVHPRFGLAQGFDLFSHNRLGYQGDELDTSLEAALGWLERNRERPFFLFFHTYEVHTPFLARQPWFGRFSDHDPTLRIEPSSGLAHESDPKILLYDPQAAEPVALPEELASLPADLYDSAIAYTDERLGRLLTQLEAWGLDRDTVVLVTSDHGEMLGEEGFFGHHYLYDDNLLVPLVLSLPGQEAAGQRIADQVRSIDLLPTLLELAGQDVPAGIDGISLLPLIARGSEEIERPAWSYASRSNRGFGLRLDNRLKYVLRLAAGSPAYGREELYDLARDPDEQLNLAAAGPSSGSTARTEALRARLTQEFEQQAVGYRLRFENQRATEYLGSLHGPLIRPTAVKAIDLPCPCISWNDRVAEFRVPPGDSFTLSLGRSAEAGAGLFVSIHSMGDDSELAKGGIWFDLDPTRAQTAFFDGSSWRRPKAGEEISAARITFWWQGKSSEETELSIDNDPRLREQLEALGYLD